MYHSPFSHPTLPPNDFKIMIPMSVWIRVPALFPQHPQATLSLLVYFGSNLNKICDRCWFPLYFVLAL